MGAPRKAYACKSCGISFQLAYEVKFCPYCGSEMIGVDGKARTTALGMIEEHNKLMSKALEKFDEYAQIYAQIETIRSTLRTYKSRGLITEEEMPPLKKPLLSEYVSRYRKSRKER